MVTPDDYAPSTVALPESDPRDAAIKEIDELCRRCIETAHETRKASEAMYAAEIDKDFRAYGETSMRFGQLRERLYELVEQVEKRVRFYNTEKNFNLFVSHTEAGLPIRIRRQYKKQLWD